MAADLFQHRKNVIREMVYDPSYTPLKLREIAYLMGVSKEERDELKEVLDALVEEGAVEVTAKGKYMKPENLNVTGIFTAHAKGFGFVTTGSGEEIFIPAPYVNDAFHRDKVLVKVRRDGQPRDKKPEGMVLKVLERGIHSLTGTWISDEGAGFVLPDDPHIRKSIRVSRKQSMGAGKGDKVVVELKSYGSEGKNPEGVVTEILGSINDPATDVTCILRAFQITEDFPGAALKEAGRIPQIVDWEAERRKNEKRIDLRDLLTVTIDSETARDLDDAITISKTEAEDSSSGQVTYQLGVHIADVSEYVTEGSALDREALERGTSIYLADRVIPMLPRELSNGICSLNAGTDRLTLSCLMTFDSSGDVLDHKIVESIIHVDRRLSYHGVQDILSGKEHPEGDREDIVKMCFLMEEAAAILKEKRRKRGSIDFDFPEAEIVVDDKGYPVDIHPHERNTATDIIEDFMLLANETVAEDYFWQELPFVYRIHEEPDAERIARLGTFIRNFGYYLKAGREHFHPKEIQKLIFSLEGEPEEALISRLALRSMKRARYSAVNLGHFGLSAQYYCHFTSPIRRYPDLQIHRIIKDNLHGCLSDRRIEHYEQILSDVAAHSSSMERRAQDAEREVEKLKKVEYMENHLGETFEGVISGVISAGFFVELDNTIEGFVACRSLSDDYYIFDEENYCLSGEKFGRQYLLGQKIRVIAESADKISKTIDFIPEEFREDYYDGEEYTDGTF